MNDLAYFDIHAQPVPAQFSKIIYNKLASIFRKILPTERNAILSMKDYDIRDLNEQFSNSSSLIYDRVIIFCVKTIRDDLYQPIASIVIPKEKYFKDETYYILGEAIKMYIFTVHKMSLNVLASVSPPSKLFKTIFLRMANIKSGDELNEPIIYKVFPFAPMVHIFDCNILVANIMDNFKQHKIVWKEDGTKYQTSWAEFWNTARYNKIFSEDMDLLCAYQYPYGTHIFKEYHVNVLKKLSPASNNNEKLSNSNFRFIEIFTHFVRVLDFDMIIYPLFKNSYEILWTKCMDIIGTMTFKKSITIKDSPACDKKLAHFKNFIITMKGIYWLAQKLNSRRSDYLVVGSIKLDYFDEFVSHLIITKSCADDNSPKSSGLSQFEIHVFNSEMALLALDNSPDGGCFMITA